MIVGAILTQNTAWSNVEKAVISLKKANALSSPSKMKRAGVKRLSRLIKPAGFYNLKAKRLANFLSFLSARYGSSLGKLSRLKTDRLREELLGINGIGPETCDSILLYAFHRPVFVVDAYTKRIFSRLRLISGGADYDEIQAFFMRSLPQDHRLFNEYHALIVRHAKERCKVKPICAGCPLSNKNLPCK
ncbi:MAG: endonuclease [Candidatus Omnitrophica bacterium]|nr:endonuclease [Candidatus Omnitrophota bacterium]